MRKLSDVIDTMDLMFSPAARRGLMYRNAEDQAFNGRTICFDGRDLVHFGSCSYLGLELDERLKAGAIDAIHRYGTQFSASRIATSSPLYAELEALLGEVFGLPALVAPTTSLAHVSVLPLLVDEGDAVILDQQVHTSVSLATNHLLVQGTHVEVVRHNQLDQLDDRISQLQRRHRRVWYMADGVYSMFGDLAPMADLAALLDRHPALHLYLDDAHGMSWTGPRGRGHVLAELPFHERMHVATSLAKAYGAGGGVLLVPDPEIRRRLRMVGAGFTFSGPLQPATLGAAVASARLHLSGELEPLQAALRQRITTWNALCRAQGLPLVSAADVPIRFIGTGKPEVAYNLAERMMEEGLYPTLSVFPAVPMTRAGLRFALHNHLTEADLERAVALIAHHLPRELARAGSSLEEVRAAFGLDGAQGPPATAAPRAPGGLTLQHARSISALEPTEWDRLLGAHGSFTAAGLRFLEAAFSGQPRPENNWAFHYFIVRNAAGKPILATFFTASRWKLDLLAPAAVSREVEARRASEPDFLTSPTLAMGSMLTEGQHLYLDRTENWREALALLLQAADRLRAVVGAETLALRDVPAEDEELDALLRESGFARFAMPESLVLDLDWPDEPGHRARLSANARKHQRKKVQPFDDFYDVELLTAGGRTPDPDELAHYHALYSAVAERNLDFNCYLLPEDLFGVMLAHPEWELLLLRLRPERGGTPGALPVAFMAGFRGPDHYVPMICGLDYRYVESHGAYRQLIRHTIARAQGEGARTMFYGIGATHEKTRFGCKVRRQNVYLQTTDAYQLEVLGQLMKRGGAREAG